MQRTLFDVGTTMKVKPFNSQSQVSSTNNMEISTYLEKTNASMLSGDTLNLPEKHIKQYSHLFYKGDISLLEMPTVSVVGTRNPSLDGIRRAEKVIEALCKNNFVVMSGLAKGVDTIAHTKTLQLNGKTIAIMGTPIHKIYPAQNKKLAEDISKRGLLLSSVLPHQERGKYLFPRRNRLMAILSEATVIVEAGPTSGVIHQASECLRQNRKLILLRSLTERKDLPWISGFLKSGAIVAEDPKHLLDLV